MHTLEEWSGKTVGSTDVELVPERDVSAHARLIGHARANQGITVYVLQGSKPGVYDQGRETDAAIAVPAHGNVEGVGGGWDVPRVGKFCKVVAVRSGGSDATDCRGFLHGQS